MMDRSAPASNSPRSSVDRVPSTPTIDRAAEQFRVELGTAVDTIGNSAKGAPEFNRCIGKARECLKQMGMQSIGEIRRTMPDKFPGRVPAGYHEPVALALEILAWHQHRETPGQLDLA